MMYYINQILEGHFKSIDKNKVTYHDFQVPPFVAFFSVQFKDSHILLFMAGVEKIPVLNASYEKVDFIYIIY